jgi:hypothetical protein
MIRCSVLGVCHSSEQIYLMVEVSDGGSIVVYLFHARTVEPQKQPLLIHARNNRTTELCSPFLGNSSVNIFTWAVTTHNSTAAVFSLYPCSLRVHHDLTPQQCIAITWHVFSVTCLCRVYIRKPVWRNSESQGARRQDKLIGGKPPVVK